MIFLLRRQCHEKLDNASGQCFRRGDNNNQPITIHITPFCKELDTQKLITPGPSKYVLCIMYIIENSKKIH